ncbi:unnamed protein product [Diatraea saccharalis]|uniref:Uncharacterized protein n=1 Tax=Diatraea saccharalis TaxID=40085 RepID=A0A9N9R5Q4_9NEOP|nr:unnamed protein product [Diatraea saccharalis]
MSEIWNFSPSLQFEVELCLSTVSNNENNKWLKAFGHCKFNLVHPPRPAEHNNSEIEGRNASTIIVSAEKDHAVVDNAKTTITDNETIEKICECLHTDLSSRYNFMIEECLKNPNLLVKLACHLNINTVEKICKFVFESNNVNKDFLVLFFKVFLPAYIKRGYSCHTLDLLLCGSKFSLEFDIFIRKILKDCNIPNNFLQDYVKMLNGEQQSRYLLLLANLDLSSEQFVHNLFSIYLAYKDCVKSDKIQCLIQSLLYEYSNNCISDKNYGRLLLSFLQTVKSCKGNFNREYVEKIITLHRSPFKRPCLTIFNELLNYEQLHTD